MKGRPADPKRERRGTGHRPAQGKAALVPVSPLTIVQKYPPPADLPANVHSVWTVAVEELGGFRQLHEVDLVHLKIWCEAVHVHEEASANVHKYGILVKGSNGQPIPNPMLRVQKDAAATIRQVSDALGLNPLARIRAGLMEITGVSLLSSINDKLDGK